MSVIRKRSQALFDPYVVEGPIITQFEKLVSRLILLEVTDTHLINQALCDMEEFFSKHEQQFLDLILPDRLIRNLINLLVSLKSLFVSQKIVLKLLGKLVSFDSFLPLFEPFIHEFEILIHLFTTTQDDVIQEQSSYILSKLMNCYDFILKKFSSDVVFHKLFNLLENCTEIDVVFNCIKILKTVTTSSESNGFIFGEFKPLFLINRMKDTKYQEQILDVLDILVEHKVEEIFTTIFSTKLLKHLFSILMQPEWSDSQNRVMQLLYKCVAHDEPGFVEMLYNHLLTFTTFALEGTSCHALACVTLFAEYTNIKTACHLLVDEELHHKLTEFFDINCEFIEIKLCTIIGNLCSECDLSEDKYCDYYLMLFINLMGCKRLGWNPYRQSALHPIHAFLARNKSVARFYLEKGLFPLLKTGIRYRDKLDKKCFRELLEVYEMLVNLNTKYLQLMLPQDIYEILFMLFKSCVDDNEGEHYICCCNIIFYSFALKRFRKRFLRYTGFEYVCRALKKYKQKVHLHLLDFVYMSINCEEFACALMHCDIINILISIIEECKDVTSKNIQLAQSIMINLKRYELMYKFSFFNTLGFNDHIESCFMVGAGFAPENITFKHENQFSRKKTVIIVNILTNEERKETALTSEQLISQVSDPRVSLVESIPVELLPPPLKSALAKYPRNIKSIVTVPETSIMKFRVIGFQLPRFSTRLSSTSLLNGRGMRCTIPLHNPKDGESHASNDILDKPSEIHFGDGYKETTKPELSKDSMRKNNGKRSSSNRNSATKTNNSNRQSAAKENMNKKTQLINSLSRYSAQGRGGGSVHSDIGSRHSVNNPENTSEMVVYEEDDILSIISEDDDNVAFSTTECRFEVIEKVKRLERDEPLQYFIYECKKMIGIRRHRSELIKWQKIAKYVDELYTPTGGYTERKYHTHINILKGIFKTCYLSIGYIRVGSICERAIMFKLICDSMHLPCELKKDPEYDDILWIEIPVHYKNFELKIHASCRRPIDEQEFDESRCYDKNGPQEYHNCVIDLINNVGALYPTDSAAARKYRSPRIFEYDSDDSVSSIGF